MTEQGRSTPFVRCYWVWPGHLLAGFHPGDIDPSQAEENLESLLSAGIRTCVDLTEEHEVAFDGESLSYGEEWSQMAGDTSYYRKPIRDRGVPSADEMQAILDLVDDEVGRGRPVYVHCLGGIGRTGTVVGCWLARHGVAAGSAVLDEIRRLRKDDLMGLLPSPQTPAQCAMVRS